VVEYTTRPIGKRSERVLDYYSINTLGATADYFALLQILFPDLASRDLALGAARSIATRYADRWYVIPDLARNIATEEIVAPRLAELAERARARGGGGRRGRASKNTSQAAETNQTVATPAPPVAQEEEDDAIVPETGVISF